eukprot:9274374-Pyramimonas_sp.AAC.1
MGAALCHAHPPGGGWGPGAHGPGRARTGKASRVLGWGPRRARETWARSFDLVEATLDEPRHMDDSLAFLPWSTTKAPQAVQMITRPFTSAW